MVELVREAGGGGGRPSPRIVGGGESVEPCRGRAGRLFDRYVEAAPDHRWALRIGAAHPCAFIEDAFARAGRASGDLADEVEDVAEPRIMAPGIALGQSGEKMVLLNHRRENSRSWLTNC